MPLPSSPQRVALYNASLEQLQSPRLNVVSFPETQILMNEAITMGITSCCALILFNQGSHYLFGHYPSASFRKNNIDISLWDELAQARTALEKQDNLKAVLVGGDRVLFYDIKAYLERMQVQVISSYLDDYNNAQVEESLCDKALFFDPKTKTAIVYSPAFLKGYAILTNKHLTIYDDEENFIALRSASIRTYQANVGDQTLTTQILFTKGKSDTKKVNSPARRNSLFALPLEKNMDCFDSKKGSQSDDEDHRVQAKKHIAADIRQRN